MNSQPAIAEFARIASTFLQQHGFSGNPELIALRGGANNRVYQVKDGSRCAVVKQYFKNPRDPRDRFTAEKSFYDFLWSSGIRRTPEPLGWDLDHQLGLMSFVEGRKLTPAEVNADIVQQALQLVVEVNRLRSAATTARIPAASEACFSIDEHLRCVDKRVVRLQTIESLEDIDREAIDFVKADIEPAWKRIQEDILRQAGNAAAEVLASTDRCLSPSDFGFHNALLPSDGRLRFFDFEYAGWDDPAKLICDFFCQPELPVAGGHWDSFIDALTRSIDFESSPTQRSGWLLPAYQIKWCCIMLNEFLSGGKARREFSLGENLAERKRLQLTKARALLTRATSGGIRK